MADREKVQGRELCPDIWSALFLRGVYPGLGRHKRNIENNQSPMYGDMEPNTIFTKEDYNALVKERRRSFVHANFGLSLIKLFAELTIDAKNTKTCHREVAFILPEHFDIEKTEKTLCDYFTDHGYKPLPEPRKDDGSNKIVITIT